MTELESLEWLAWNELMNARHHCFFAPVMPNRRARKNCEVQMWVHLFNWAQLKPS